MADQSGLPSNQPKTSASPDRRLIALAGIAALLVLALVAWRISANSPSGGKGTSSPTAIAEITPTPFAGAATFTPVSTGVGGPRVVGITAGVGMRAGDVAGIAPIAVTFSEAMDKSSAQSAFEVVPAVSGDFKWQENTLLFTPQSALSPSTAYTVTMSAAAKTGSGKELAVPLSASFKTAPPPAILRTLPSDGATEVPLDTIATITFNRPMIPLTALDSQPDVSQWVSITPSVAGRWVWLGTSAVGFRADAGFLPSTLYTIQVKEGWTDSAGVPLTAGTSVRFTTIRPAILSVSPSNGARGVSLDAPVVLRFNQPMDHPSVEQAIRANDTRTNTAVSGTYSWSPDSTVMTFTASSLLAFSRSYVMSVSGQVRPANGTATELVGGSAANTWSFTATDPTSVQGHSPDNSSSPVAPSTSFGFYFNNPLAPNQDVAGFTSIDPTPEGYNNVLEIDPGGTSVFTGEVRLLPNTTYRFQLRAGLKDKWGFDVAPAAWTVNVGPLPPGLALKGGGFQPVYADGPSRVRIETVNLDKVTLHLHTLSEAELREMHTNPNAFYNSPPTFPGKLVREWDVPVSKDNEGRANIFPAIGLNAATDRLPVGFYFLRADAPTPYSPELLQAYTVLMVGRAGVVTKSEGQDLLVWVADLGSGKPLPNYPLRVEQWRQEGQTASQRGRTGPDGVLRLKLDRFDDVTMRAVWSEQPGDAMFASTAWNSSIEPYAFGASVSYNNSAWRGALYTDRPIYRPAQVVYYRGVYRLDDDASYTLAPVGTVSLYASTYGNDGETVVYTGTATLSPAGTLNGQFTLPANAPTGDYTLSLSGPGQTRDTTPYDTVASASFQVQEYRKPDFQVNVDARDEAVQGDPVTATIQTSYYFGGPLANVTTTVNLQTGPYNFYWSDPDTGESYTFGEGGYPHLFNYDYGPYPGGTPEPLQSFQAQTNADGILNADVSRYVSTTNGSKSLLVEGQVQDLSNQAVANSDTAIVHQGLYYVGLRVGDYVATAKKPVTITVRTVNSNGERVEPNRTVNLTFTRRDWIAPRYGSGADWKLNEVQVGQAAVTTDANGRATYLFTPPSGGDYTVSAVSTDSRGNTIRTSTQFWASSDGPGYVSWRYNNEKQIQLVADKTQYKIGDTARILVTSPFTQATGLLTVERGHIKRYRIVNIEGGAPTIEVPLVDGDLPNVYVSLALLGPERAPEGAPADWADHATLRMGYVNLPIDTSGKQVQVSIEPQGKTPFAPGSTAGIKVRTLDSSGRPVSGELSLAVVDEAIYALADDISTDLFSAFWGERGTSVSTSSSFSASDGWGMYYGGGRDFESVPMTGGAGPPMREPAPTAGASAEAADQAANSKATAPKKVRADFRDTAFWTASVTTGADGTATIQVPLPDNLTTWRLTAQGITADTQAGMATQPMTVTQALLLRPVQPRFLTTGDNPHPQAIIHNNTAETLNLDVSLEVSGALTLETQPAATRQVSIAPGAQAVVTWSAKVGKGDVANLRYWARTADKSGSDYLEDAVSAQLPVKAFAAPEAVATSGEVSGTRADESVFLPYSVNPLLGELVVQVSPSLAAATTDSLRYVQEYPYESTDQTVSRFLPLVVLEQVYNEQGLTTPYSKEIPGILERGFRRLADLQQPDGGWAWWERGPSVWWETAYTVQGLSAARDAGYAVPGSMLQRGIERLRGFMGENISVQGIDETYHLNMRAYTLYVLSNAVGADDEMHEEGRTLAAQAPRISNHARAWLAMALAKGGQASESKQVLDSLAAEARQSSTTAHWEESSPDYWSMGTDNRATALAIDALVTLSPDDPLVPKAVRWLMTAEKEGHWLSSQETAIALVSLAHYMRQSKELTADYVWQVDAFDKLLGQGAANSGNLTQTTTLRLPVADMPQNTLGNLALARSGDKGKMYYQISLRYYVPGEGIKSRSEGLAITRSYHKIADASAGGQDSDPVTEVQAGDLVKVRLMVVVPETSYYVLVTDPLPAGLEGVNGSLNTTSFTERPPNPMGTSLPDEGTGEFSPYYDPWYWRWGPFDNVEMRDDRTVLFATYMGPGTYVYEYYARATTPGVYMGLPAHAELLYYPDVFGHSDGGAFTVK
ncbi:MAG TPA: Ig-like domain-containing protein [Chloroflexia bacterium]